jgi:hypothetical protein
MANFKKTRLVKISLRISPLHLAGLQALRDQDAISIQDHIRRSLDNYLARPAAKLPQVLAQSPAPTLASEVKSSLSVPNSTHRQRKVVFR